MSPQETRWQSKPASIHLLITDAPHALSAPQSQVAPCRPRLGRAAGVPQLLPEQQEDIGTENVRQAWDSPGAHQGQAAAAADPTLTTSRDGKGHAGRSNLPAVIWKQVQLPWVALERTAI